MARPCFKLEKVHPDPLAGVDEAGCAPLAGPVVAAAVILDRARFPRGMDLRAMAGLGMLCGIGFTMSLFIGSLAFPGDAPRYAGSVAGVLVASTLSALAGLAWLRAVLPRRAVDVD